MRRSLSLYRSNFFGLTPEYRLHLFKTIHDIVFHGRGGYDFETVYNMPIWLRNATFRFIADSISKENEAQEKAITKNKPGGKETLDWVQPKKNQ
jgi:hypothetical protein